VGERQLLQGWHFGDLRKCRRPAQDPAPFTLLAQAAIHVALAPQTQWCDVQSTKYSQQCSKQLKQLQHSLKWVKPPTQVPDTANSAASQVQPLA
jgi:hypothetical protein